MPIEIDARKEDCPKPVIMAKNQLNSISEGVVVVIVDNEVAKENVSKLANSMGYNFTIDQKDKDYYIRINKENISEEASSPSVDFSDLTIGFSSVTMGNANEDLGKILMKSYIYTITETIPYPSTLVFYNEGVKLTCRGSDVLDDIIKLEKIGVEVISCGTCLDFLNIKNELEVGSISNMYTIYEKLKNPGKNIIIG